jgi:hypothetical protein
MKHRYHVDFFRGTSFLAAIHGFHNLDSAVAYAHSVWEMHREKPENKGCSWQVNEIIFDGEGEPSHHVTVLQLHSTAH